MKTLKAKKFKNDKIEKGEFLVPVPYSKEGKLMSLKKYNERKEKRRKRGGAS